MSTSTFQPTPEVPRKTLLQQFIEGNYFYVLSAGLVMLGCYLLMKQPDPTLGVFERTLRSLLILQAYEVLVITTAIVIARRFRKLGDGFTLLVIELALILDPTFFSNSFLTMIPVLGTLGRSLTVNGACFVLAAVKLVVLQRMLGLRFSTATLLALGAACFTVYFGTLPLNLGPFPLSREASLYLVGWMAVAVCLLMPALPEMVRVKSGTGDYMAAGQATWLPRWLMILPVAVVISHYIESANVYGIRFYWCYGAPLLLGAALLIINNQRETKAGTESLQRLVVADVLSVVALLLSVRYIVVQGKAAFVSPEPAAPPFIEDNIPIKVLCAGLVLMYVYAWRRLKDPTALVRVAVMGACGGAYFVVRYVAGPALKWTVKMLLGFAERIVPFLAEPVTLLSILFVVCLTLAWRKRNFATWMCAGFLGILLAFRVVSGGVLVWAPEVLQAVLVCWLVLLHHFGDKRNEMPVAATTIALVALGRGFVMDTTWAWGVCGVEAVGFIAAGTWLRRRCYLNVGLLQSVVMVVAFVPAVVRVFSPAAVALAVGGILFVVGVLVTFRKESIMRRWALQPAGWPPEGGGSRHDMSDHDRSSGVERPGSASPTRAAREVEPIGQAGVGQWVGQSILTKAPAAPAREKPRPEPLAPPRMYSAAAERRRSAAGDRLPGEDVIARHLLTLFVTDPDNGVLTYPHLPEPDTGTLAGVIEFVEGEQLLVSVTPKEEGYQRGAVLLTNRAAYLVEEKQATETAAETEPEIASGEYRSLRVMEYSQIAGVGRQYATLTIRGHSAQEFVYCGLTTPQALIVKTGLEKLVAEIAFEFRGR